MLIQVIYRGINKEKGFISDLKLDKKQNNMLSKGQFITKIVSSGGSYDIVCPVPGFVSKLNIEEDKIVRPGDILFEFVSNDNVLKKGRFSKSDVLDISVIDSDFNIDDFRISNEEVNDDSAIDKLFDKTAYNLDLDNSTVSINEFKEKTPENYWKGIDSKVNELTNTMNSNSNNKNFKKNDSKLKQPYNAPKDNFDNKNIFDDIFSQAANINLEHSSSDIDTDSHSRTQINTDGFNINFDDSKEFEDSNLDDDNSDTKEKTKFTKGNKSVGNNENKKHSTIESETELYLVWKYLPMGFLENEVDVTELISLLPIMRETYAEVSNELGLLPFILKSISQVLKKYSIFNSRCTYQSDDFKVNIVPDHLFLINCYTPAGVKMPLVEVKPTMTIKEIALMIDKKINELIKLKITGLDVEDSTFNVNYCGDLNINRPVLFNQYNNLANLSIGSIFKGIKIMDKNSLKLRDLINVSVSYNQGVIELKQASDFLNEIIYLIKNPSKIM